MVLTGWRLRKMAVYAFTGSGVQAPLLLEMDLRECPAYKTLLLAELPVGYSTRVWLEASLRRISVPSDDCSIAEGALVRHGKNGANWWGTGGMGSVLCVRIGGGQKF